MRENLVRYWPKILDTAVWACVLLSAFALLTEVPFAQWAAWSAVSLLVLVPLARVLALAVMWWEGDRRYALVAAAIPVVIAIGALIAVA